MKDCEWNNGQTVNGIYVHVYGERAEYDRAPCTQCMTLKAAAKAWTTARCTRMGRREDHEARVREVVGRQVVPQACGGLCRARLRRHGRRAATSASRACMVYPVQINGRTVYV